MASLLYRRFQRNGCHHQQESGVQRFVFDHDFFSIAGHYFLMNAQFLAAVHIIVYAGAIMVLFLYVIMMLNLNNIETEKRHNIIKLLAVSAVGLLLLVLSGAVQKQTKLLYLVR